MVNITHVDLLKLATSIPYYSQLQAITNASTDHVSFLAYDQSFVDDILGTNATQRLVADLPWDAFHEAGVYNMATRKIYAASNWAGNFSNPINVTAIDVDTDEITSLRYKDLAEANGGAAFYPVGTPANSSKGQQIVFCDEGDLERGPSQLVLVDPATNKTEVLINSFLGGRNFSSLNDIEQHPGTGDLWFTDARYAYWYACISPVLLSFRKLTILQAILWSDSSNSAPGLSLRTQDWLRAGCRG